MTKGSSTAEPRKRPYERPSFEAIELKAEETLAKPCKVQMFSPGPITGCGRNNCAGRLGS